MSKVHHLFISHSWDYGETYQNLIFKLKSRKYFNFNNYSIPSDSPVHTTGRKKLREAIKNKQSPCDVIIVLAGVYSTYSAWINEEIDIANKEFKEPKPILAIEPWGSQKTSSVVKDNADKIVKWNTESIVNGIRQLS